MSRETVDRRSFLKITGGAAAAVSLAGCTGGDSGSESTPESGGDTDSTPEETETSENAEGFDLTVTAGQMDSGLDPQDHAETTTDNIVIQAYEGLLDRDKTGGIIEGLATNYERVEPGLVRFTLREGVTFHNGDALTAEDAAFSIRRIVFEDVGIPSPQNTDLGTIAEVTAGDGEVTIGFENLNPIAFQLFATNGEIMQQSWVEEHDTDFINQNTNGTGPFKVTSYDSDTEVVFEGNEDYWQGAPDVNTLTWNAAKESSTRVNRILQGESDITVNVPPQEINRVQNADAANVAPVPSTRIIFLQMRYDLEPFSSKEFRQALNYAVDLDSIIENVLDGFGSPTGQPTLEAFVGHNPDIEPYPHDPARAEELVEQSGHAGVEITLQTPIGRYLKDVEVAQAAAEQINSLSNVTCTVQQREFSALVQDLVTGNIEDKPAFNLLGWGNGEFDASMTITPLLTTGATLTVLENETVDNFKEEAGNAADPDERIAILQEANAFLHDHAPWVFMHQQFSVYGVSDRIEWEPRNDEAIDPYTASLK
jgi:peptide/nickel transport system substrate-binding protein